MSNAKSPNVIEGMLSIHAVITRGLHVAAQTCGAMAEQGPADGASREGFISYLRCLISLLNVHHQTEDALAFPYFRERLDAPYDLLTEQHRLLHPLLEEAQAAVEEAAAGPDAAGPWMKLSLLLHGIGELWRPHIAIEEEHFTVDRFASLLPPEEHLRLTALFMQHTQQHTGPDYLMVPFLLFNLPPGQRSFFAGEMPAVITQQLVPVVWKEKWAPMQPYLMA
jgi:hemerythrin-like domain-containing protein